MSTECSSLTKREDLENQILKRTAKVGVLALGYVGLPLAVEFAKVGFHVVGIDVSPAKVDRVNSGHSYVLDVPESELGTVVENGQLRATTDFDVVSDLDTVNICVPTPLRKSKDRI